MPIRRLAALLLTTMLTACAHSPESSATPMGWSDAGQLVLVTTADWDATTGELRRFERDGNGWRQVGDAAPISVGRTGTAWGIGLTAARNDGPIKREGDGKAPAGVFAIGTAFGYAEGAWTDSAVRRYVRDAGDELERLHILTRADVTTRNKRKASMLAKAYDDIERRIVELQEQEELGAMRPALDGNRIQALLGIPPGRDVGAAYKFLLEVRLDEGVISDEEAEARLRQWWAARG